MSVLRWLWPGIGVKRWIAMFGLGVLMVSVGLTVLLGDAAVRFVGDWLRNAAYLLTGSILTPFLRGLLLIVPGLLLMGAAAGGFVRAALKVLFPTGGSDVGDLVYQRKYTERGPKIVAIGGGTGLGTLLRGLKLYTSNITAIVTVTDDGGSSGRLRGELGLPPPGDIRNCLVALADTEPLMESLFQHRFSRGTSLEGHSFGNLFIAAMAEVTGDFERAVRESSRVLAIRGRVLPSTNANVVLHAEYTDGSSAVGETAITARGKAIARVWLEPAEVKPLPESLEAIAQADLIVLGPGSVYSSVAPNLLIPGIPEAIATSPAKVVYIANIMTEHGETDDYGVAEHLEAINQHAGRRLVDVVIENEAPVPADVAMSYAAEQAIPVPPSRGELERRGARVVRGPLLAEGPLARHDPFVLAQVVMRQVGGRSRGRLGLAGSWSGFLWLAEHLHLRRERRSQGEVTRHRL